ncbi:SDR family NAD(P)-dependent oxidoreductase [Paenibacillus sp. OV219]|uniref:SDR family NAD(P)-dependent oxidoreductase n=1 Tax=Paenibacillus sp. OV219 TaxID=1884377 RepID=UPI0008D3B99F|nr:glucose 1-dehydrogenase [Paenibacillus sp. OV219]SEO05259.1 glucose 1-dehydrogenase/3-oxoacyl-[acyl-carrier protein] reductase [Paenibacillus sp. OV219]
MGRLFSKVAIVTGAGMGIGRAIALKFASEGACVAAADLDTAALESVTSEIRAAGGTALPLIADVTVKADVDRIVERTFAEWGAIDVLVTSAGICQETEFLAITEEEWDRHLAVNLKGTFLISQQTARTMVECGTRGSIIHISSVNGMQGEANQAHYNVSKAGVNLLTMSMAVELGRAGIRVNAICPGFIQTRLTQALIDQPSLIREYLKSVPLGRVGQPEEVANMALFLASYESNYVSGQTLVIDGGQLNKLA